MSKWTDDEWDDIVDLLTYIAAADRRTVGKTDVRVWLDAAQDGQWPSVDFAYRAVRLHRREQPGKWLEPGHITKVLDRVRDDARRTFVPPTDREMPQEALDDPRLYQQFMRDAARRHSDAVMSAFAGGQQVLALEAAP